MNYEAWNRLALECGFSQTAPLDPGTLTYVGCVLVE